MANLGARLIFDAFTLFHADFAAITRRARSHFERRDWHALRRDAAARLDLYGQTLTELLPAVRRLLAARLNDQLVWAGIKAVYSGLIAARNDWEIAETFFNSVTRRIFTTVGVDPRIEFVDTDFDTPPGASSEPLLQTYPGPAHPAALLEDILADHAFAVPYENPARDAHAAAEAVGRGLDALGLPRRIDRAQMLLPVFYRGQRAYLVGRLWCAGVALPLVIALSHRPAGIAVDAVLTTDVDISILFSFTRSYFHVDVRRTHDLVCFLHEIMPQKRIAELYTAIGHNRHGKTELYRQLLRHLDSCADQFVIAPGARGMVMLVFTLPSFDVVFKIIRDAFEEPKRTSREEVLRRYSLVFKHDRAGRLIDAQEFEHLEFDRARFAPALLDEMRRLAADSVLIDDSRVAIRHLYVERRVHPLDLFIRQADDHAVADAVIDYGHAVKDLACANIFPGDLLLKNFGVTRHGRVVFYDYDELCLLTECHFRQMPQPADPIEEMSAEPWFYVGENDCFPAEFKTWLGLPEPWRGIYLEHHADLFTVDFWRTIQNRINSGEVIDILPYSPLRLLHPPEPAAPQPAEPAVAHPTAG